MDIEIDLEALLLEFADKEGYKEEVLEVVGWLQELKEKDLEDYFRTFNTEGLPKEGIYL